MGAFSQQLTTKTTTTTVEGSPLESFSNETNSWPSQNLDGDEIQLSSGDLDRSLLKIGGIQSRGGLSGGSPTISSRGSGSVSRFTALYDGLSLNKADGFGPDRTLLPTENIERVHVIKGPNSVFYGSGAMGGALNFIPRRSKKAVFRGQLGSFGEKSTFGRVPLWKDRLNLTGFYSSTEGNYPYRIPRLNLSGVRKNNEKQILRTSLLGQQKQGTFTFKQNIIVSQQSGANPGMVTMATNDTFEKFSTLGQLSAEKELSPLTKIKADISFLDYESVNEIPNLSEYKNNSQRIQPKLAVETQLTSKVFATIGGEYQENYYSSSALEDKTLNRKTGSVSATGRIDIGNNLFVQPGIRVVTINDTWVPALALVRETKNHRSWLSFADGYNLPSLSHLYGETTFYRGNPNLEPEKSNQVELGLEQKLKTLSFGGSLFFTNYSSLIVTTPTTDNKVSFSNQEQAQAYGGDVFGEITLGKLFIRANYNYLKTKGEEDRPLIISPENQLTNTIGYKLGNWTFSIGHKMWSSYYDQDFISQQMVELEGWNVFDTQIVYEDKGWKGTLSANNLFDQPREITLNYPEPQQSLLLSVSKTL